MKNMDFKKLEVDKKNDVVSYNDADHVYWTTDGQMQCISATTLIHKFTTFDGEFWSRYKALEAVTTAEDFKLVKGGLLDTKKFNYDLLDKLSIDKDVFENKLTEILAEWEEKKNTACERGTNIHLRYEMATLDQDYEGLRKFGFEGFSGFKIDTNNVLKEGKYVIPEMLISRISEDGVLRVAGQADLIVVEGKKIRILDYKTNKKIDTKSFFDRKKRSSTRMKYPLNNLDDVNFWHYTMQLSLYAWMLEKANPDFEIEGLYLLHHDHDDNKEVYKCEYRKAEVERMLAYYKQQLLYDEHKKKNEKCH